MTVALGTNIANPISTALSQWPGFDTMGKLANYGKLGVTDPDAVITALFANGEQGAWYDPSDLSTMFQESTGQTPVTADGQPVGLSLDKSQGLILGPEQAVNGDFSNGSTGWTLTAPGDSSASVVGAQLVLSRPTGEFGKAANQCGLVQGRYYKIEFDIGASSTTDNTTIQMGTGAPEQWPLIPGFGHHSLILKADADGDFLIYGAGVAPYEIYMDNFTIKEVPGNHALQANASARPLKTSTGAADWTNYDGVDDALVVTFPSSLGSSCTVCRANVGGAPTILTGQTIGTSYSDSTDNAGLIIIDRALTGQETTDVTAWLTAKGATS